MSDSSDLSTGYVNYLDISSSDLSDYLEVYFGGDDQDNEVQQQAGPEIQAAGNNNPNEPKRQKVTPPQAQRYIGAIICKETNGVRYLGSVTGYDDNNKWFRVQYEDDDEFEDMEEEAVLKCLARKQQIASQFQASSSRSTPKRGRGCPKKNGGKRKISGAASKAKRTRTKKTEDEAPYVPLVLRENKKDDYVWYHR